MPCLQVDLEPIDPLQFGDNRSARAGEDHVRGDQDPSPITLYGAVGAHLARCLGAGSYKDWARAEGVLGEFCRDFENPPGTCAELLGYCAVDPGGRPRFPLPAHGRLAARGRDAGKTWYLLPPALPAAPEACPLSSVAYRRTLATAPAPDGLEGLEEAEETPWIDEELLAELLSGNLVRLGGAVSDSVTETEALFARDVRIGVAIDPKTGTNDPGKLFSRPYRRFRIGAASDGEGRSAGYRAWYRVLDLGGRDPEAWSGIGFLGGERARALLSFAPQPIEPLADLQASVLEKVAESKGFLAYLLTPAAVPEAPLWLEGREPVAAALGKGRWISGWKAFGPDRGPRPMRRLWPEGSVFFFEWKEGEGEEERRALVRRGWLQPLVPELGVPGFGRMLVGVWS